MAQVFVDQSRYELHVIPKTARTSLLLLVFKNDHVEDWDARAFYTSIYRILLRHIKHRKLPLPWKVTCKGVDFFIGDEDQFQTAFLALFLKFKRRGLYLFQLPLCKRRSKGKKTLSNQSMTQ